ncbi:VapE domain-containing protein [Wenyingzhuangia aestuarii]|uniref:VapE domain-containing protein n=1 Tax=Wenyingzhuangia aestuarii TaxID=1647582 RepID=UPI00143A5DFE|nr:VapE domain-containing protein [Wenyingzhuangia aestuarii]NJB83125.1 putative P-loop ATPase [Wenyingzhuangia aestuarii]
MKDKTYHINNPVSTIYDRIDEFIKKQYVIVFNEGTCDFDIKLKHQNSFKKLNIDSLSIALERAGYTITDPKLEKYLKSDYISKINPINEYFKNLPEWNQKNDYIKELVKCIPVKEKELFEYHFKKWLVRTVKCGIYEQEVNKQCLVFIQELQNTGKTTFCRYLCPPELKNHFTENIGFDKDSRIQLCTNFMINMDELESVPKNLMNTLKSYFSKQFINERLPYDKRNSRISRKTSFIGSTNLFNFLNDDTGSVRWLCFELEGYFDFNYSKINIDSVWSQAYHLSKDKSFECQITREDQLENERRNKQFTYQDAAEELILKHFTSSTLKSDFKTSTDIVDILRTKSTTNINSIQIGKALNKLQFPKDRQKDIRGYLIKFK